MGHGRWMPGWILYVQLGRPYDYRHVDVEYIEARFGGLSIASFFSIIIIIIIIQQPLLDKQVSSFFLKSFQQQ